MPLPTSSSGAFPPIRPSILSAAWSRPSLRTATVSSFIRRPASCPRYDLVLAKGGSKLQPTRANGKSVGIGRNHFNGQGLTLTLIAEQLSEIAGRIVVDKTGLTGRYDLKLQWTPDNAPETDNSAPSLFTAIQEQLGLKLESSKEPVPVLVIDHIERPSEN